jgi:G3E family GTPase
MTTAAANVDRFFRTIGIVLSDNTLDPHHHHHHHHGKSNLVLLWNKTAVDEEETQPWRQLYRPRHSSTVVPGVVRTLAMNVLHDADVLLLGFSQMRVLS